MPQIRECVVELSQLLSRVSGQGLNQVGFLPPAQRASVQLDADGILQPLMDFLHGRYIEITVPELYLGCSGSCRSITQIL